MNYYETTGKKSGIYALQLLVQVSILATNNCKSKVNIKTNKKMPTFAHIPILIIL
jgi:hypothetical protein